METIKIVLTVVLICFLQSLPIFGQSDDLSESNREIYKIFKAGQKGFDELCTKREPDLITNYADILSNASKLLKAGQQGLDTFCNLTEPDLITKHAADILSFSPFEAKIKEIYYRYPKQIAERIIAKAIGKLVSKPNLLLLPDVLLSIYDPVDSGLFEMMLRAPMPAYIIISKGKSEFKYEFFEKLSYMLYTIREDNMYAYTTQSLKSSVEDIIKILPPHFIVLFFKRSLCIINIKYWSFVYTSDLEKWYSDGRGIWIWQNDREMNIAANIKVEFKRVDSCGGKQLKLILQGTDYKVYYYMEPERKEVYGLKNEYSMWDIEHLDDDRVYISHDGFNMCAAEQFSHLKETFRRRIRGVSGFSATDSGCEWRLLECPWKP